MIERCYGPARRSRAEEMQVLSTGSAVIGELLLLACTCHATPNYQSLVPYNAPATAALNSVSLKFREDDSAGMDVALQSSFMA